MALQQCATMCSHPVLIRNTCTKCGEEINGTISTIPLWYIYPDLNLSFKEINCIRDTNLQRLLSRRKLHLVLDLDHTLVHTRKTYKLSPEDRNFVRTRRYGIDYNLPGKLGTLFQAGGGWTKLRPYVRDFLREASTMFDMTIHTLGCKFYAWSMAKLLDPNGRYFENWRVISRDDCVALDKHKKFLDVVLEHERVVVVMDDNEDVWEDHKTNLLKITPYNYFSYFSPEDKVHDASPPRLSWSQLNGDESEENGVLARALDKLRLVHAAFFDDSAARIMETGM
ncbi:RNA polymerase II C-terminal domain phosphatase-like 4 [Chenopodium quinoa]|uniref:RNA polymerase II C-terminal domain phosphatase-like 4 n=1 Tax=Chenopodium quinoa TaxID=63459 RepID=UPI000B76D67A|nr:RNA polymerase II C-terminal domain phosphatase-like 4 [Chenopodium quinoa]